MAIANLLNINGNGLIVGNGAGTFTATTTVTNSCLVGAAGNTVGNIALTSGQMLIGSTGSAPVAALIGGTTNQVNVATGAGTLTLSTPQNIDSAATVTFGTLTLSSATHAISTATDTTTHSATAGPTYELYRNGGNSSDADLCGEIKFTSNSSNGTKRVFGRLAGTITTASNGAENSQYNINTMTAGTETTQASFLATGGQIRGQQTSGSYPAQTGFIGEQIASFLATASAVSLVNATAKTVTNITLTTGTWDISIICGFGGGAITGTGCAAGINTTTNVLPASSTYANQVAQDPTVPTAAFDTTLVVPTLRVTTTTSTTYYLIAYSAFSMGTVTAYGRISAVRSA